MLNRYPYTFIYLMVSAVAYTVALVLERVT